MSIWATALDDLKGLLDEGNLDKYAYRKRCLGDCNGTNLSFKTFDNLRQTDFTTASPPVGVWISGVLQDPAIITEDFPDSGDFTISVVTQNTDIVEASYYYRWFLDSELIQYLISATNWLSLGSDYTTLGEGLRPGALKFAASDAYQKLAIRWARKLSEGFMLNDAPGTDMVGKMIIEYGNIATKYREDAEKVRDDFYSRSGQQKSPAWAFSFGHVQDPVPKE